MAFDGRARSYLSVFPLPDADLHAFVRTWPGPSWQRAGSVWSHAIFLNPIQLSRTNDFTSIAKLFRQPQSTSTSDLSRELARYETSLPYPETSRGARPPVAAFDMELASAVAAEFYTADARVGVGVGTRDGIDELILALLSQQWPGLRRSFSARTRSRPSESSWQVELEIVDRPASRELPPAPSWARFLAQDMQLPSADFRDFLGRYGAESRTGRLAMPPLVTLYRTLARGVIQPAPFVETIRQQYPHPKQMRLLKRDLVGQSSVWSPPGWPDGEADRLTLAFDLGSAADFTDLDLGRRLVRLILESPHDARVREIPLNHLTPGQAEQLVGAVAEGVTVEGAVAMASAHPDLGLLIAARKPQILVRPQVWDALDNELAVTVFSGLADEQQASILDQLLAQSAVHPLLQICERTPDVWWRLLFAAAEQTSAGQGLMDRARTLRAVLDRVGSAAIGLPPRPPTSPFEVVLVMLAADLSAGLWRRCPPSTWARLVSAVDSDPALSRMPQYARDRVHAVALLTAGGTASAVERTSGWKQSFGYLHERLKHASFDGEAWRVLANALPSGGADWDRCQRLRRGLVAEIRRDKWSRQSIDAVVIAAGASGVDILTQLAPPEPTKRKSILQEFIEHLFS